MAGPNMQVFCSSGQFLQPDLTFPSKTEITSFALPENVKFDWENFLRTHTNFIWRNVRKEDKVEQAWTPEQCQLPKSPSGVDYPDPRAETLSFPELPPGQHRPSHTGYTLGCLPSSVNNIKLFYRRWNCGEISLSDWFWQVFSLWTFVRKVKDVTHKTRWLVFR